jgi:hypothetical protein
MVAPASDPTTAVDPALPARAGTFSNPPCPLPPDLRADVAHRRAQGHPWDAVGCALRYSPDALRRACDADPAFAQALERARAEAAWEAEADGLRRLRQLAAIGDDAVALKAAEVLVKYARERRRDETRLECERLRADTRLEAERARTERAERRAAPRAEEAVSLPRLPSPETEEERRDRFDREHAARAAEPKARVYVWGGRHPLGRAFGPDEADTRVRLELDESCGVGMKGGVYWVVADGPHAPFKWADMRPLAAPPS